ncbi:hypothetical protein ASG90_15015 [Nocardioides sp. Soil797]|nr:hypothetical protein ASG90_15015 [Nocardioides sp. Soil797]
MSVSLEVDGSPAGCRAASRDIRTLAGWVGASSDMLAASMRTACGAWSGSSSDAFTDFAKERIHRADELHEELLLFAAAMEGLGLGLADVKAEMRRARNIAAGHGIPVGANLPEVGEITLEPGQEGPLDHAVGVANRAREHETRLQSAWQESLARVSKLVWDPAEISALVASTGKSLSGPLDKLSNLPGLSDVDPSHLAATAKNATGLLQSAFSTVTKGIDDALPGGPRVGPIPLIMLMNPHLMQHVMVTKAVKTASPPAARKIDAAIKGYGRGIQKVGESYCKAPSKVVEFAFDKAKAPGDVGESAGKSSKHIGVMHSATCKFVEHDGALKYTDLLVEATDAK